MQFNLDKDHQQSYLNKKGGNDMLSISTKTQYGLVALIELAENYENGLVKISDIVKRRNVPRNYLEQILNRLLKVGIVKSVRGNRGGYQLGDHPDNILLISIVESLEGPIYFHNSNVFKAFDEILEQAGKTVRKLMDISLSSLMERQRMLEQQISFVI